MEGFLKAVVEVKKEEINRSRSAIPLEAIRHDAEHTKIPASFADAMAASTAQNPGIIAEVKKASPSKGDIRPDLDPAAYAEAYTKGGARAISVLTESRYFKGALSDLEIVCRNTDLPVLRKDFIFTEYQIYEAKKAGASTTLLITTLLSGAQQSELTHLTRELGMEPLVEINSEWEFEQAYQSGARVVGINNRNLTTLETDPTVAKRVAKIFPEDIIAVEASGISGRPGIEAGIENQIYNFLVGESIVRAKDPAEFINGLCGKKEG
ncbi:MAG: indole-3-glycerol phosphate synthase TrpC [Desulfobacterales bacterium]|nr:indole-3-glycerol phosphate synthase TrpC [Desulfobacterales bacterium]